MSAPRIYYTVKKEYIETSFSVIITKTTFGSSEIPTLAVNTINTPSIERLLIFQLANTLVLNIRDRSGFYLLP